MFSTVRRRWVASLLITLTLLPVGCDTGSPPSLFAQNRLVIGVKNDQPGTSVWDAYKRTGFDIEVAYHLAKAEHVTDDKKVLFDDIASDDRVQAIKENRVDLVIATFSMTPGRMEQIDFAGPYAVTYQGFMVRKGGPVVKTIDDLNDKDVCTWTGTTSETALARYPRIHTQVKQDAQTCINALESGQVAAASTDQLILYGFAQQKPDLEVTGVTIGTPNFYGVGIGKAHRADCKKLADAIFDYVTSSDWQKDFTEVFKVLDGRWSDFRPREQDISSWSCKDKLAN